jgi:hypothetical protein
MRRLDLRLTAAFVLVMLLAGFVHAQESAQGMHNRISSAAASRRAVPTKTVIVTDAVTVDRPVQRAIAEPFHVGDVGIMDQTVTVVHVHRGTVIIDYMDRQLILTGVKTDDLAADDVLRMPSVKIVRIDNGHYVLQPVRESADARALGRKQQIARLEAQLRDPFRGGYVDGEMKMHRGEKEQVAAATREIRTKLESLKREEAQAQKTTKGLSSVKGQEAPSQATEWRTWTDSSGSHKIEAQFGGIIAGTVKLIKRDDSIIKIPIETLSDEDQEWIKNRKR